MKGPIKTVNIIILEFYCCVTINFINVVYMRRSRI